MQNESENLATLLNRPLAIGSKVIHSRLVLAPMSKLGNLAFREIVAGFGGYGLLFSEMAGSRSVASGNKMNTGFVWRQEELPFLVCQLFGDEPEILAEAARRVEAAGFFGVDINFGCSVKAVCKKNCGAALLRTPDLAVQIVSAVRKAVSIPLFVKFRTGWQDDPRPAVDLAQRFADAGADALTFHPRVAPDRRTRPPKWEYIRLVKEAVHIPVFGNGNVFDAADCAKMLGMTGCDGVSLGRLAIARPWIFAAWTKAYVPDSDTYAAVPMQLLALMEKYFGPETAMRRFYKFAPYYASNFRFGHSFYSQVHRAKDPDSLREIIKIFFASEPETVSRPNITLLR
ncbi:MAG: tRNA-dihydrouridine synthase family protein [Desulfobacterales bacterium]